MLKMALGGLHEDPHGGKGGRKGAKIRSMRRKGSRPLRRVISNVPDNVWRFGA